MLLLNFVNKVLKKNYFRRHFTGYLLLPEFEIYLKKINPISLDVKVSFNTRLRLVLVSRPAWFFFI